MTILYRSKPFEHNVRPPVTWSDNSFNLSQPDSLASKWSGGNLLTLEFQMLHIHHVKTFRWSLACSQVCVCATWLCKRGQLRGDSWQQAKCPQTLIMEVKMEEMPLTVAISTMIFMNNRNICFFGSLECEQINQSIHWFRCNFSMNVTKSPIY